MNNRLKIDFVSDVSCPWCVIGLKALEEAISRLGDQVTAELHVQPFELNPQMPAAGQDIAEHMMQKYGSTLEQSRDTREAIRARGADLGFEFRMEKLHRIYNTFNAHRLLHWAAEEGHELALKHALFDAYFTHGRNLGDHQVLVDLAAGVGLDPIRAAEILATDAYAKEVREQERFYLDMGVHAVPSVIINDRHLIQGGQPVATFEGALRRIAAST
jgi:predicted DsbA family dithiol-disulfide isomerase